MRKCRHKKLILASTHELLIFIPDQEPYEADKIECCGISEIIVHSPINIHYCPKCKVIRDIELEDPEGIEIEPCTSDNRCDGH